MRLMHSTQMTQDMDAIATAAVWSIWQERNDHIFIYRQSLTFGVSHCAHTMPSSGPPHSPNFSFFFDMQIIFLSLFG